MDLNPPITIIGLLSEFILSHKKYIVYYLIFLSLMPFRDIGIPHIFGKLVQSIEKKTSLVYPLVLLLLATTVLQVMYSFIEYLEVELSPRFQAFVRQKIMKHVVDKNTDEFREVESGNILAKLMRLPHNLYIFFVHWKYNFIPNIILSVLAILYFSYRSKILGFLLALLIVFSWTMIYYSVVSCKHYSHMSEKAVTDMYEQVDDILRNMFLVINNNQQHRELDGIADFENTFREEVTNTLVCSIKLRYIIVPFNVLYFAVFTYICYNEVKSKRMQASYFVALIMIVYRIFNSIWDLSGVMNDVISRWGTIKQSMEVFKNVDRGQHVEPEVPASSVPNNGFYLDNIKYSFKDTDVERKIFDGFSLHIEKAKTTVLVGSIGSGKSTVLKFLLKQLTPQAGNIYYQGVSYKRIPSREIRRMIGYIPQQPTLFNRTIYENITYGLEGVSKKHVRGLIQYLDLQEMFARFPNGIDTTVGKYGSKISGGQRQVILILRVILKDPPILLMDEPTASIDESTKDVIYSLLAKLIKGKTVVMVTHDKFLLKFADRIIYLKDGKIVKDQ